MSCFESVPKFLPHTEGGILSATSKGNGSTIKITWFRAFPTTSQYTLAYNIYFSTLRKDVFSEGIKYISIDPSVLALELDSFTPGDTYYFAVRATQYLGGWTDLSGLPDSGDSKIPAEGVLLSDLAFDGYEINVSDIDQFPNYGIVQIGKELIRYLNKDIPNNLLKGLTRGFLDTDIRLHLTSGFDGYETTSPLVTFFKGLEEPNEVIHQETAHFDYPNYPRTDADGYKEITKDFITTDLSASQASEENFPRYDFTGWRRTNPLDIIRGTCIGTYIGGERFCADGYNGVGRMVRGISVNDVSAQRLEVLLDQTGDDCVLVKKMWTGKVCACFDARKEYPDDRCILCNGLGKVSSYVQFFNPRRSDGRIKVRFDPNEDKVQLNDSGFESIFNNNAWTLVFPIIKDRDFLVRLSEDKKEEYRYEVMAVGRNKLFEGFSGAQKLTLQRVRKTDPIYNVRVNYDTSEIPSIIQTTVGFVPGPGGILPHTHDVKIGPKILVASQINQLTEISLGHNHLIRNGIIENYLSSNSKFGQANLGHTHQIVL
jgi:hypothetical protein